jgi:hypothetical protein
VAGNSTPAANCKALPDIQQDASGTAVRTLPPQSTLKKRKRVEPGKGKKNERDNVVDVKGSMERMHTHALVEARAEAVYANISNLVGA